MAIARQAQIRTGEVIERISQVFAYGGGILLSAVAIMTVVSIIGRQVINQPVPGDYELVANGVGLAVFGFLPLCQLKRGHVTVDILIGLFPLRLQAFLGFIGDLLIAIVSIVLLRQLWFGFGEKFPYGSDAMREVLGMGYRPFFPETTYELEIPIWLLYGAALFGAALFALVSVYTVWRSLNWVLDGQEEQP